MLLSLCPSLCLLRLVLSLPSWAAEIFQFLDTVPRKIKRHKWSFVKYIVSFSGLKMVFSKLSLAKYHFLHKKPVFTVISIYFISCLQLTTEKFHVFIYYSTSLQIFLFYKFFCTNISTIFRSSHQKCYKKAIVKHFVIFTGKHLWWGLFLIKLKAIRAVALLQRDSNTYFLVNFGKFIKAPILKNISERLHFWKVFCENIFSDQN